MNTPAGAVAPRQSVPGYVLTPGSNDTVSAEATASHKFLTVVEELVRASGFHTEEKKLQALRDVAAYRKQLIGSDHRKVVSEDDVAPVEDVRDRKPPAGAPVPQVAGPAIDYNALAAALIAQQQAAQERQAEAARAAAREVDQNPPAPAPQSEGVLPAQ